MTGLSPGCSCCGPCGPTFAGEATAYLDKAIYCHQNWGQDSFSNDITDWVETWYKNWATLTQRWRPHGSNVQGQLIHEGHEEYISNINGLTGKIYRYTPSYTTEDTDKGLFSAYWRPQPYRGWPRSFWWLVLATIRYSDSNYGQYKQPQTYGIFLQHACENDVAVGVKVVSAVGEGQFAKKSGAELKNALGYGPMPGAWVHKDDPAWYEQRDLLYGFGVDCQHVSIDDGTSCKFRYCYYISNSEHPNDNGVLVEGESDVALEGEIELRWEVSKEKYRLYTRESNSPISGGRETGRVTDCWGVRDVQLIIKFDGTTLHESDVVEKYFNDKDMEVLSRKYKLSFDPLGVSWAHWNGYDDGGYVEMWLDPDHRGITSNLPFDAPKDHADRWLHTWQRYEKFRAYDGSEGTPVGWSDVVENYDERDWYFGKPEVYTEIL